MTVDVESAAKRGTVLDVTVHEAALAAGVLGITGEAPAPTLPAPTLTATPSASTPGLINLSWTAVAGATHYWLRIRLKSQAALASAWLEVRVGNTLVATYYRLPGGVAYQFQVQAANTASGRGAWSATAEATTPRAVVSAPTAPRNLAATASTTASGAIALTWDAPTSGGAGLRYHSRHRIGTGAWVISDRSPHFNRSETFHGTPGTTYEFQVRAETSLDNWGPWSTSATATAPTIAAAPVPGTPTITSVTRASPGSREFLLRWSAVADVVEYRVDVRRTAGADSTEFPLNVWIHNAAVLGSVNFPTPRTTHGIEFLVAGSTYQARVRAGTAAGAYSPWSTPSATFTV